MLVRQLPYLLSHLPRPWEVTILLASVVRNSVMFCIQRPHSEWQEKLRFMGTELIQASRIARQSPWLGQSEKDHILFSLPF